MSLRIGVTANDHTPALSLFAPGVTASTESRTLAGPVVRYGELGRTSRGLLKVRRGALYVEGPVSGVKLTKEHIRSESRGHASAIDFLPDGIRAAMKVSDGPEGDAALREAQDHTRDGFSFDVIDEQIEGDEIVSGRIIAIGQVGIPAYDGMRIDTIAASMHTNEGASMRLTPEQRKRLAELRAQETRTTEEEAELQQLVALALDEATADQANDDPPAEAQAPAAPSPATGTAAPEPATPAAPAQPQAQAQAPAGVAASIPAVPGGIPSLNQPPAQTQPRGANAFEQMISRLADAFALKRRGGDPMPGITAALNDVTSTANTGNVEPLAWSGELFSGVAYEPVFSGNLEPGDLTNWKGQGWRITTKPEMQDYAGDKAAIPSGTVVTEDQLYEAARAAVGIDIDRKYFDFPNADFLAALFNGIAETWLTLVDQKSGLFITSEAVASTRKVTVSTTNADATVTAPAGAVTALDVGKAITGAGIPNGTTVLSVTDATHFELSANATATAAGVVAEIEVNAASLLKAAARVSQSLRRRYNGQAAPTSTGPDYLYVNDEDWFGLMDITELQLPAYLEAYGVKPETFIPSEDVPAGAIIGGVKRAGKLRTESRSPIAVDALNLANGGVDKAFFGYWAIEQQHLRGIQKVTFSEVVEA